MASKLEKLTDAIDAVDPARIKRMYPSEEQFNQYLKLKGEARDLLEKVTPRGLPSECESQLGDLTNRLLNLANQVSASTELGGRLLVNHMVVWAEAQHLERAIYLAGSCEGRKVKEPYRTQINLQPANACMTRYRQIFQIVEWIRANIEAEPGGALGELLAGMLVALLEQFEFFAVEARRQNDRHVHAIYMVALAFLFRAHECRADGDHSGAENYSTMAKDLVLGIDEPTADSLKVQLQYHKKNYEEFCHFERLYERHSEIASRLKFLSEKASNLLDDGGGSEDPCHFWFSSYVGGGARAASIVGLICAGAGAFGVDPEIARTAIENTWRIAVESIPGMESFAGTTTATEHVALNTIGSHSGWQHTGGLQAGGLITNFEELKSMVHTGGLV